MLFAIFGCGVYYRSTLGANGYPYLSLLLAKTLISFLWGLPTLYLPWFWQLFLYSWLWVYSCVFSLFWPTIILPPIFWRWEPSNPFSCHLHLLLSPLQPLNERGPCCWKLLLIFLFQHMPSGFSGFDLLLWPKLKSLRQRSKFVQS